MIDHSVPVLAQLEAPAEVLVMVGRSAEVAEQVLAAVPRAKRQAAHLVVALTLPRRGFTTDAARISGLDRGLSDALGPWRARGGFRWRCMTQVRCCSMSRQRSRLAVTAWPMLPRSGRNRNSSAGSHPIRRSRG